MKNGLYIYKSNRTHSLTVKDGYVYMRTIGGYRVCQELVDGYKKLLDDEYELQDSNVVSLDEALTPPINDEPSKA